MTVQAKEIGKEMAETINELDRTYKKELLKAFAQNIDRSTRIEIENALEVII
jgi:hypothetical protein